MDGWPKPVGGGEYPNADLVTPGKVYTDEEEKRLHAAQDTREKQSREDERKFRDGII